MSRIGKRPIPVPAGVSVAISGNTVTVKGPKGELARTLPADIAVAQEGAELKVTRPSDEERHKALHGLSRTLVANMVDGVTKGFVKTLEITGVGYKAEVKPYGALLSLGYSHQIEYQAPAGVSLSAPNPTTVSRASTATIALKAPLRAAIHWRCASSVRGTRSKVEVSNSTSWL